MKIKEKIKLDSSELNPSMPPNIEGILKYLKITLNFSKLLPHSKQTLLYNYISLMIMKDLQKKEAQG